MPAIRCTATVIITFPSARGACGGSLPTGFTNRSFATLSPDSSRRIRDMGEAERSTCASGAAGKGRDTFRRKTACFARCPRRHTQGDGPGDRRVRCLVIFPRTWSPRSAELVSHSAHHYLLQCYLGRGRRACEARQSFSSAHRCQNRRPVSPRDGIVQSSRCQHQRFARRRSGGPAQGAQ
jgi:hypothetical protein